MNTTLWIVQGIGAAMFIMAGIMKSFSPMEKLNTSVPWSKDFSAGTVRFVGLSELLGGIGLMLPMLTGIVPILTPIAAAALAFIMICAAIYHARKNEMKAIGMNFILFAITAFIAYGRFCHL